ncbi:unnamed protein product, partial [Rotaria sordida]
MMSTFGYDCLYYHKTIMFPVSILISFCRRPELVEQSNDVDMLCYGQMITFKELKINNVSISHLFYWNAAMEIIDLYEKYLIFPNLVNENEFYCNCSLLSRFGKFCQYDINEDFDRGRSLNSLLSSFDLTLLKNIVENRYFTCYIGIQCHTNLFCLDWRQICNGVVDCDFGEDEPVELCLQMELNSCDPETEFRCETGLCVPRVKTLSALVVLCPDQSDADIGARMWLGHLSSRTCLFYPSYECDELNRGWKQFSCNNGQFIPYSYLTSKIPIISQRCINNYHLMYLQRLFFVPNKNPCWISMICLADFDYLYPDVKCFNEIILNNIEQYCPNEYYFPLNSVVYSYVYFLYDKLNRTNWLNYTGPNYICYKKEYCPNLIWNFSVIIKNNLTCFSIDQKIFSWKNFYEYVIYLFSPSYWNSSLLTNINDKMLYKCDLSNTFISIYRVKDKKQDCFFNDDENPNIDLCLLNTNDQLKCLTNENECTREIFINDNQNDCLDESDEYFEYVEFQLQNEFMRLSTSKQKDFTAIYRFQELCDGIVNYHLFSKESNETDEADCEYWPLSCNSYYTKCDSIWNCENGHDEIACDDPYILAPKIHKKFSCKSNEHYCIKLINNNNDINITCINLNQSGDGIIDCIGGTDEQLTNICVKKYPTDRKRRFYCMNSSLCIRPDQVCDTIIDCPFEDDERVCPWLFKSNLSQFYCNNSLTHFDTRCGLQKPGDNDCQMNEHIWFCDLSTVRFVHADETSMSFERYPPKCQIIESNSIKNLDSKQLLKSSKRSSPFKMTISSIVSLCNYGYPVRSSVLNNSFFCFCPPSYYGDYCQYQSERLTVKLLVQPRYYMNPLTVFRLFIYLLDENNRIQSHDEFIYNHKGYNIVASRMIYLMYERYVNLSLKQRTKSKFVRLDSYIIKPNNIQYISSWLFNVSFPFLPVNRLVINIFLLSESFRIVYCKKRCGLHGKCMHYVNAKHIEYCWCNQGWFGEMCQLKSSSNLCHSTSCAPHSQCIILDDEKKQIKCICPLGKSGDQCYITHNACFNIQCGNDQTCLPFDQRDLEYACICRNDSNKNACGTRENTWNVSIDTNLTDLSTIPAIFITLGEIFQYQFSESSRKLYKDIVLPTTLEIEGIGSYGFVQMFHNLSKSFYYAIAIRSGVDYKPINTSVISRNLCPNVSELFNETVLYEYSYLKRLKLYHLPCQLNHNLRCFFDQYRMCICTKDHNSHCFRFSYVYDQCNYCQNNGLCLRQSQKNNPWIYTCLCPKCTYGEFCQFSSSNYFITLEILLGAEMKGESVSFYEQSTIIHITLAILLIILFFNLIFNTISLMIFSNQKIREIGCDLYLLYLTILSEIGLIFLFLRYLYMIIIQIYLIENLLFVEISCKILEYFIRLVPSLFDWLTVCISIERLYIMRKGIQFTRLSALKTLKISRWVILIVFLMNILTTLHRPFYLMLFHQMTEDDEFQGHPWCIFQFNSTFWNTYEKIINICHLTIPFILNIISVILFLIYKTKLEFISSSRKKRDSIFYIIKEQLFKYISVLISTIIIIILEIPRLIFTFTFVCIDYSWQRYLYLTGYFISFLPLTSILFIYIIPSPKYKKQLKIILNKILCQQRAPCQLDWAKSSWTRWIQIPLFLWVSPILSLANKRNLIENDLNDLSKNDKCSVVLNRVNQNNSKWPARISQPLLIRELTLYIKDQSGLPAYSGYLCAIGLCIAVILQATSLQQMIFRNILAGIRVRNALSTIIYQHLLTIYTAALHKTTAAQTINLVSNDANKFAELSIFIHALVIVPLEVFVIFGLLWWNIGLPTLFGYAVLIS